MTDPIRYSLDCEEIKNYMYEALRHDGYITRKELMDVFKSPLVNEVIWMEIERHNIVLDGASWNTIFPYSS